MNEGPGITIVQVVAGIIALVLMVALLLPVTGPTRHPATLSKSASQVRGILQSLVFYSEFGKGRYPGIGQPDVNGDGFTDIDWNGDGIKDIEGSHVEPRFYEMLSRNLFTGELITSRFESKTIWTTGLLSTDNYSYALLDIDVLGSRKIEWKNTINAEALVVSDRNYGTTAEPESVLTNRPGLWHGVAGFNDGHVETQKSHIWDTKYGTIQNKEDNIFTTEGTDDAYMIYEGN